jgi:hypothetical protein
MSGRLETDIAADAIKALRQLGALCERTNSGAAG